jgi:hypothetical protein
VARFTLAAIIAAGSLILLSPFATAQDVGGSYADSVRVLYQSLEYDAAEEMAIKAIDSESIASLDELADLHFLLGLVRYVRSDSGQARADFETVLSLNEAYEPDPVLVPPRVMSFFDNVRAEMSHERAPAPVIRYVMVHDPRPEAALRSAILPGWGHWHRGEPGKGILLAASWTITAGTALSLGLIDDSDNPSLTTPKTIAAAAAGAIWLYSYLDALMRPVAPHHQGIRIAPAIHEGGSGISASVRF